ncbi:MULTISPECIES: DUF2934 domain-containing protein [Bradyrhizobium]|uniref:DUF2934 domain-containing protein n=1 Tax=Bradyrhizobium TaxID=374 RepID=UPI002867C993|nr:MULTISPECIES: DUF2934 domain-containing protein [Bradyrhizobium]
MDHRGELQRLQHQLELANRMIPLICDVATVERLESFAKVIKGRLDELQVSIQREETCSRAFVLWLEAGRPEGRDLEFWLRAEREWTGNDQTSTHTAPGIWNRRRSDDLNPQAGFPADSRPARPLALTPPAPHGEAVLHREVRMAHVYDDDIRARAYKLWEESGRPEGRRDEFWQEAERQLKEEQVRHELKTPDTL